VSREAGLGRLLVTAAAVCWSTGGLLARLVGTDPWTTVFWRGIFCAAFLVGVIALREGRRTADVFRAMGGTGLAIAVCFAAGSTSFIVALSYTAVANVLVILSLSPFMAGLLGWLWMGERVAGRTWAAMSAALLGSAVMVSRHFYAETAGSLVGDLLALGVALTFAMVTALLRRRRHVPMLPAAALAAALTAAVAAGPARPGAAGAADLLLLAGFGAGQLGLGMILFTAGARRIPVAEAALIAVLESVLGPIWVWLAIGENPGAASLLGGAIVLAALAAHTLADLRDERRAQATQSGSGSGSRNLSSTGT
jgi:drug/metabolite transporter (DMT)-like permease